MRVVLDTNVFVSALITRGTPPDRLYQAWNQNRIELVTSAAQVNEITDVLARPRLRKWVDRADAGRMVADICRRAYFVGGMPVPRRSPDPKDDVILATAVAGQAVLLVTGDKRDILSLGRVEDVRICTPGEALRLIPQHRKSS